jgi:hypothetical protein
MTSGYTPGSMPEKDQPGFDQILRALREGLNEDPRLKEMSADEVARQLVLGGHLEVEPPSASGRGSYRRSGGRGAEFAERRAFV